MVDIIEKVKKDIDYDGLNMRIGIHTVYLFFLYIYIYRDYLLEVSLEQK